MVCIPLLSFVLPISVAERTLSTSRVLTLSKSTLSNLSRDKLTLRSQTVTVIIPSVGEFGEEFKLCIDSILRNSPARIIVTTAGLLKMREAQKVCEKLEEGIPMRHKRIIVTAISEKNKRSQFIHAVVKVATPITCYADDHVFWPPAFLKHALAPFEDPLVGLVGTVKRVHRIKTGSFASRLLNYIAVIYLERHNFECTASYNIDGGVFIISGRTALTRTEILHSVDFRQGYLNETWWWGEVGPMKVDDDNYITRFMVNHGYKTVFHNEPAALMETTLGTEGGLEKFSGQLLRWVRTTWRSHSTSLFAERKTWSVHPWTTYAIMISLFFNISLIYDTLLFVTLHYSSYLSEYWCLLVIFLVASKTIKQIPHLLRNTDDIWPFWIFGMLFGYVHSCFKIWGLFTAGNIEWCGRKGIDPVGRPCTDRSLSVGEFVTRKSWRSSLPLPTIWRRKS
jgi:cellulose synthase/poly-beta-1,6-N-acetylglucosamine synthase-like glycosyltransferase